LDKEIYENTTKKGSRIRSSAVLSVGKNHLDEEVSRGKKVFSGRGAESYM